MAIDDDVTNRLREAREREWERERKGKTMTAEEIAAELMKTPKAEVLLRHGNDWLEVCGVAATGSHRNAVTLLTTNVEPVLKDKGD